MEVSEKGTSHPAKRRRVKKSMNVRLIIIDFDINDSAHHSPVYI